MNRTAIAVDMLHRALDELHAEASEAIFHLTDDGRSARRHLVQPDALREVRGRVDEADARGRTLPSRAPCKPQGT